MATIYKNKYGMWLIEYFIDNKRYRKSLRTKDEKEALEKKKAKEAEILILGNTDYQKKLNIENAFFEYLHYKKLVLKDSSYQRIEIICDKWLRYFKTSAVTSIQKITDFHVEHYVMIRKKDGISARTINYELQILQGMMKLMWEKRKLKEVPIRRFPLQKKRSQQPDRIGKYTPQEISRLKEHFTGSPHYDLFTFLIYTGCRLAESYEVKKKDVDLENNIITIRNLKTENSPQNQFRYVPLMNNELKELLGRRIADIKQGDFVFQSEKNMNRSWLLQRLKYACGKLNIQYRRVHGFRHTFISYLLNDLKYSLKEVMKIVGHVDATTTMRYSHVSKEDLMKKDETISYN